MRDWYAGIIPEKKEEVSYFTGLLPFIYTYLCWAIFDVVPAVLVDHSLFKSHRTGTTASLIISYIYTVTPSVLFAANYL